MPDFCVLCRIFIDMNHRIFSLLFLQLFLFNYLFAQLNPIGIGQWREHLSFRQTRAVAEGNGKIYCATTGGVFSYNLSDGSYERLTKVNGYSDVSAVDVEFNPYNNTLLIAYKNTNIDLVKDGRIVNIADIKRKVILGEKTINKIYFYKQYAYLACGFGMVVVDTDKEEIKDTYYIGPNGTELIIYDITCDGSSLYAATENGVYVAPLVGKNLSDFNSWTLVTQLPKSVYNTITYFAGKVFVNLSMLLKSNDSWKDTVYVFDGNNWSKTTMGTGNINRMIRVHNNKLVFAHEYAVVAYDAALNKISETSQAIVDFVWPLDALVDKNGTTWFADRQNGLQRATGNKVDEVLYPNGPRRVNIGKMSVSNGRLWALPVGVSSDWHNLYNRDGVNYFVEDEWFNVPHQAPIDTAYDIHYALIDPDDEKHVYLASFDGGLIELNDQTIINWYKETNSALRQIPGEKDYMLRVSGMAFDEEKNMWVVNTGTPSPLKVMKKDGTWITLDFSSFSQTYTLNQSSELGQIMITSLGQKWVNLVKQPSGILVYKDETAFEKATSTNARVMNTNVGSGALPSGNVNCFVEDHDGAVWVGTQKGIAVFFSPENIFTDNGSWDSQPVYVENGEFVEKLLETESITAITIDGANRKWIGTSNSGVYLMSEDGTKEIYHFTEENSPLFGNPISDIKIDPITGEVFISTINGLISYRGDATEGSKKYQDVYAFPNPVEHDYNGPIAIKGLVTNANVRITDIHGGLVYSTKALGGQAIWYGNDMNGKRVSSGVYMVFCTNDDGSKTYVTKILFIN